MALGICICFSPVTQNAMKGRNLENNDEPREKVEKYLTGRNNQIRRRTSHGNGNEALCSMGVA